MKTLLTIQFILLLASSALAQRDYPVRPFQLTLVPPLGTNGFKAATITNNVSINLIAGYNGGVKGLEVGGILNVDRADVQGVQLAGFLNLNQRTTQGAQVAGFMNVGGTLVKGAQLAGFLNVSQGILNGVQLAGFMNQARTGKLTQVAGFLNRADSARVQVAGFLNIGRHVKGLQLGVINISDTLEGVAIGIITIARRGGLREFEVAASPGIHTSLSFKLGTPKLYTIFSAGQQYASDFTWLLGMGFGTRQPLRNNWAVSYEIMAFSVTDRAFRSDRLDLVTQFKPTLSRTIRPHFQVFAGPALTVGIADHRPEQNQVSRFTTPYFLFSTVNGHTRVTGWVGLTGGVRF